ASPRLLHRRQHADLVVDEHVVLGGIASLDVVELQLLVDVDQHAAFDRVEETRALDLPRLEHDVAVRKDDRRPEAVQALEHVERLRIEPVRKRIVDQERRHGEEVWIARIGRAVALECSQVVRVPELAAKLLEELPVAFLPLRANFLREIPAEVARDAIVVDERVVDVDEEDDRRRHRRRVSTCPSGWPTITRSAVPRKSPVSTTPGIARSAASSSRAAAAFASGARGAASSVRWPLSVGSGRPASSLRTVGTKPSARSRRA